MKRPLVLLAALAGMLTLTSAVTRLPVPVARTLQNGLRVVVFQRPGLPIVQAQLQVAAGLSVEEPGHAGLAYLTAQLLRQGTTSRSADDFATELDTLGATLGISVTRDGAQLATGSRTAEFEGMLELLSDAVVNPLFSDEAFEALRHQVAGQLAQQAQSPAALADERALALAFGSHPYGHSLRGNIESLLGATREHVRAFHRDHWRPDHAVLAIAGDIDTERAFAAATEWFGRWGGKAVTEAAHAAPSPHPGTLLYDLPGSPSTEVRAVLLGPGRAAAGYAGWFVAREALAGSLLPQGAHATLIPGRDASVLMVSASARPESTASAVLRVRSALRSLTTLTSGDALAAARRRAAGVWALSLESLGQVLATWLSGDVAGLPAGQLANMQADLLTADLSTVAHAVTGGYTLLLAGPAERMKGRLAALGAVETLAPESELTTAAPGIQVSPEQRKRGKQLIAAAVLAHGGAAKLAAAHVSEQDGEMHISVAGQALAGESRYLRVDPDRLVYTSRLLELEHRQVLDGARGWALSMVGDSAAMVPSDSTSLQSLRSILESDVVHLLRAASQPKADPIAQDRGQIDGKPVERVDFVAPYSGRVRLSFDPVSHRIAAVEALPTPQGLWRERRKWSEYIQVEGVWWPRQEVREVDGEKVASTILRRLVVNGDVDSTLFRRPLVVRGQLRGVE